MERIKGLKGVSSVVVLKSRDAGPRNGGPTREGYHPVEIHTEEYTNSSTARKYRPLEKRLLRVMRAQAKATTDYIQRHESSARKKKNGWLKDFRKNTAKSVKSGFKVIKPSGLKLI